MTIQFKLSPRWLFASATELGGEVTFGKALQTQMMINALLALHPMNRKRDEAHSAPRASLDVMSRA